MLADQKSDGIIAYRLSDMNCLNAHISAILINSFYFTTALPNNLGIYSENHRWSVLPNADQFTPYKILILPIPFASIDR